MTHHDALFVDEHPRGHVDEAEERAQRMVRVDESRVGGLRGVVEGAGGLLSGRVLGDGDDLEALTSDLFVDFLPTWQVPGASSPGGPGEEQHLLAAEVGEVHDVALSIR